MSEITTQATADQESRMRKLRAAALEAAELAVLGVSAGDVEEIMMRHSAVSMTVPELRHAVTLVHNSTITLPEIPKDTP